MRPIAHVTKAEKSNPKIAKMKLIKEEINKFSHFFMFGLYIIVVVVQRTVSG